MSKSDPGGMCYLPKSALSYLMDKSSIHSLLYLPPVLYPLLFPEPLAPAHHNEEDTADSQAHKSGANEAVLVPQILDPGCDAVSDSKAHRVPYYNAGRQGVARDVAVRVDEVRHRQCDAHCISKRCRAHGEHEAEPVDAVSSADAPEDERGGDHDGGDGEQPQAVLGLGYAVVLTGQANDESVRKDTRKSRSSDGQ